MTHLYVWILVAMHVHGAHIEKEYMGTFSTVAKCQIVRIDLEASTVHAGATLFCEQHIVE